MSAYAFIFKVNQKNMKMNMNVPTYSCLHSDPQKRVTGEMKSVTSFLLNGCGKIRLSLSALLHKGRTSSEPSSAAAVAAFAATTAAATTAFSATIVLTAVAPCFATAAAAAHAAAAEAAEAPVG